MDGTATLGVADRVQRGAAELSLAVRAAAHSELRHLHYRDDARRRAAARTHGARPRAAVRAGFSLIFLALGATATAARPAARWCIAVWISRVGGVLVLCCSASTCSASSIWAFSRASAASTSPTSRWAISGRSSSGSPSAPDGRRASGRSSAASSRTPRRKPSCRAGCSLLGAYSLGLAIPFLSPPSPSSDSSAPRPASAGAWSGPTALGGALMIVVGLLLITNYFTTMATYLQALTPAALRNRL